MRNKPEACAWKNNNLPVATVAHASFVWEHNSVEDRAVVRCRNGCRDGLACPCGWNHYLVLIITLAGAHLLHLPLCSICQEGSFTKW